MENNATKTWQVILGIIALAIFGVIVWGTPKPTIVSPQGGGSENVVEDPTINATQLCYIWNTEAGDSAKLSMDIRGEDVWGEFYWLPAERDSKTGIFQGKVSAVNPATMSRTVNALWEASAEGTKNTEELIIVFGEGTANVGFGEMAQASNGVWRYVDPNNLSYAPNLQQTDCGDDAMD